MEGISIYIYILFHLLLPLLLLLSSAYITCLANVKPAADTSLLTQQEVFKERGERTSERALIGSTPPKCETKCLACGHCEAIEVPVSPQVRRRGDVLHTKALISADDAYSNYKPLSWKCKCGNLIFNP